LQTTTKEEPTAPHKQRKTHKHLNKHEVVEIEELVKLGTDFDDLIKGYDTSKTILDRIIKGTHIKSSEPYKTYIMKQALGEPNDNK